MNSFFDKAKDLVDQHDDKVDQGLEKAGDLIDDRTGGKYTEHIDRGSTRLSAARATATRSRNGYAKVGAQTPTFARSSSANRSAP